MYTKKEYKKMLKKDSDGAVRIQLPNWDRYTADDLREIADEMDNENLRNGN